MRRFAVAVAAALALAVPVSAHKFHASLAEIDLNPKTGHAEVAVRLFADDLEDALSRAHGRRVRIDTTAEFDAYALAYVQANLVITDREKNRLQFAWVGKEAEVDDVWVYVEAPAPAGLNGALIADRVFFELFDDQVNTVIVKRDHASSTLVFKTGDREKAVPEPGVSR